MNNESSFKLFAYKLSKLIVNVIMTVMMIMMVILVIVISIEIVIIPAMKQCYLIFRFGACR